MTEYTRENNIRKVTKLVVDYIRTLDDWHIKELQQNYVAIKNCFEKAIFTMDELKETYDIFQEDHTQEEVIQAFAHKDFDVMDKFYTRCGDKFISFNRQEFYNKYVDIWEMARYCVETFFSDNEQWYCLEDEKIEDIILDWATQHNI